MSTDVLSARVHTKFHELIVYKTISKMIMLLHIPYYLDTILRHVFLDVGICAYWSPQNWGYPARRTFSE